MFATYPSESVNYKDPFNLSLKLDCGTGFKVVNTNTPVSNKNITGIRLRNIQAISKVVIQLGNTEIVFFKDEIKESSNILALRNIDILYPNAVVFHNCLLQFEWDMKYIQENYTSTKAIAMIQEDVNDPQCKYDDNGDPIVTPHEYDTYFVPSPEITIDYVEASKESIEHICKVGIQHDFMEHRGYNEDGTPMWRKNILRYSEGLCGGRIF
jgi:hypothetical protein